MRAGRMHPPALLTCQLSVPQWMGGHNSLAARDYCLDALAIRQNFPAVCLANRSASARQGIVETVDRYCVTPSLPTASATLCESKPQCTQRLARRFINTCFT